MKILVVQVLRLGDVLMSAPVISGLRTKFPKAEIHVLAFRNFCQVEDLIEDNVTWHWLDRAELQDAIGDANASFFRASDLLEKHLRPLRELRFDWIVNLSQTRMSGWICSHIRSPSITGLHFDDRGQGQFGSSWFKYLNDHVAAGRGEVFHYLDLFRYGCEVEREPIRWNFRRSAPGQTLSGPYALAQVTTSDSKKTYPSELWRRAFENFLTAQPRYFIGVLAAPNETEALASAFAGLDRVRILECSLAQALAYMDGARLLVTGDTSIKHLANASSIPVLEMSIGSSDFRKTGVYKPGSWILQGRAPCAPCPHSGPCSQKTHECALNIKPEALALAMSMKVRGEAGVAAVAKEFGSAMELHETFQSPSGIWLTRNLSAVSAEPQLLQIIEKSAWKFLLQREFQNPLASYGSESLGICQTFQERFPEFSIGQLREQLDFLESETSATDKSMCTVKSSMERLLERPLDSARQEQCFETMCDFLEDPSVLSWISGFDAAAVWPRAGEKVLPLTGLRRLQTHIDELSRRTEIRLKLIRSIKSQIPEKQ